MNISVVIPTLNEEMRIAALLLALRRQTLPPKEILVVDAGSGDSTVRIAASFREVRIVNAEPPVGAQRNLGLREATGEMVVFLDADTRPSPTFLEESVAEMRARKLQAACPKYDPGATSPGIRAVYWMFNGLFSLLSGVLPSGAGSCIFVERSHALRCGGIRSDLVYDDAEFIRRVARSCRFGCLSTRLQVSDRRFREYGVLTMLAKYLLLSAFFTFGLFRLASVVSYPFSNYRREAEEHVVVVDDHGRTVRTAPKSEVHTSSTPLHLAFSLFLFDRRGRVLLQQRSGQKLTWPLHWSNSCCGHLLPEESLEDAVRRRTAIELGINEMDLRVVLPNFRYRAELNGIVENEVCPVLVGFTDQEPNPLPEEVADFRWMPWDELVQWVRAGSPLTPWCVQEVLLLEQSPTFYELLQTSSLMTRSRPEDNLALGT
ncbi:MAG: hypothetical protein AMXMBFR61_10960 [Fimbriimonadales bacterium]